MTTSTKRKWTELSSELLGLITEQLSAVDYIRFGAVSTSWASVVAKGCFHRPQGPQSPWLLLLGKSSDAHTCTFFSVSDNKSYKVASMPELTGKWLVGSIDGWVVTMDEVSELRLLNPLTRAQIQLPSITTVLNLEVIRNSEGVVTKFLYHYNVPHLNHSAHSMSWSPNEFRGNFIYKVVLSSSPIANTNTNTAPAVCGGYTAMAIATITKELIFMKAGDNGWSSLYEVHGGEFIDDVIYYKGKFYTISWNSNPTSELRVWDLTGPYPKTERILEVAKDCETNYRTYLVESSGDLLKVLRHHEEYITTKVKVFKFNRNGLKWDVVDSLGHRCLFLGLSCSMSFSASEISGLLPNCIYFADDHWNGLHAYHELPRDLGIFNLEDGSFKPWHPYDSPKNWPTPIWFMPNPF